MLEKRQGWGEGHGRCCPIVWGNALNNNKNKIKHSATLDGHQKGSFFTQQPTNYFGIAFKDKDATKVTISLALKNGSGACHRWWLRTNHDTHHKPTVCQCCWCMGGGILQWEVDDCRSNRVRVQTSSLLVSSWPAF